MIYFPLFMVCAWAGIAYYTTILPVESWTVAWASPWYSYLLFMVAGMWFGEVRAIFVKHGFKAFRSLS